MRRQHARNVKILINNIISEIKNYDYISFDIFDTLIKRDVPEPHTIFKIMEELLESRIGKRIDNFCIKRIEAERNARRQNEGEEVNLSDIYNSTEDELIRKYTDELIELEEKLEFKASCTNYLIYEVYNWCIGNNKHIILVSDMYLREELIIALLFKCKYDQYERLFLSSTWKKRKADNGELFRLACSELRIQPDQLIHVGDSKYSDGKMPEKVGCKSVVVPCSVENLVFFKTRDIFHKPYSQYKVLKSFCQNRKLIQNDYLYSFGYEAFGPLLAGFSKWLYYETEKESIRKLYFFSRDGLILKEAFDELYDDDDKVCTKYLLVSRRSLRVPLIWLHPEYFDVIKGFPEASMQSIVTFFDTLGLDFNDYEVACSKLGIGKQFTYKKREMSRNKTLMALYDEIKTDVICNSKNEYEALRKYLRGIFSEKKVAVIDIGWRGSIQKFLMEICDSLDINIKLYGYYIGLASGARNYSKETPINFKGYVFDCNVNSEEKDVHSPFVGLIETLFLAQEGSTKRYFIDSSFNVEIELYDNEYVTESGKPTKDAQKVALIQKGAMQFVRDYRNSLLSELNIGPEVFFKNLYEVGMHPSRIWRYVFL